MKTKYIFLILCFLGIAMGSCKDDSASNPTFADDELYIYTDMLESVSAIAGTLTEFPILVSPADGSVSVKWLLDGEVIGTAPTLSYTFTQTGSFKLRFEAVSDSMGTSLHPLRMRRNLPGRTTQETIQDYLRIPAI